MLSSIWLTSVVAFGISCHASEHKFDVKDDIFAFPQYDVSFPPTLVSREEAEQKLAQSHGKDKTADADFTYEYMVGNGRPYLCAIPQIRPGADNKTENSTLDKTPTDLVAAADRGWQLLHDMEGQQCLYYRHNWWTYAFCYNQYVKQYHALQTPPHSSQWPPVQDPSVDSYMLGKFDPKTAKKTTITLPDDEQKTLAIPRGEVQTAADTTYLSQMMSDGTPCDVTGTPRRIEVQYHCSPGTPDRVGWIKETAICTYQMVIYTSRLCNDVAFQPPKDADVQVIDCLKIVDQDQVEEEQKSPLRKSDSQGEQVGVETTTNANQPPKIGRVVVGSHQILGDITKPLTRGRVVMTQEELAQIDAQVVVVQKDGKLSSLSTADLKKLELNPKEVEGFVRQMRDWAGKKDFHIKRKKEPGKGLMLEGILDEEEDEAEGVQKGAAKGQKATDEAVEADVEGSEEVYKQEL